MVVWGPPGNDWDPTIGWQTGGEPSTSLHHHHWRRREERGERQRLPTHFTTILNDISSIIDNLYVSQSLPSYHPPTTTLKVYNHDLNFYKMVSEGLLTANTVVVYSFITSCAMSTFTLCLDYQHLHNRLQIQPHV